MRLQKYHVGGGTCQIRFLDPSRRCRTDACWNNACGHTGWHVMSAAQWPETRQFVGNHACCQNGLLTHMGSKCLAQDQLVRVILVVLHLKTRDRWQMAPGIVRLMVSARSMVLGTALPVESVGSKQILHGEIRAGLAGEKSAPLEPACSERVKVRGKRGLSVKVRCCGVGGGQGCAHSIAAVRDRRKKTNRC